MRGLLLFFVAFVVVCMTTMTTGCQGKKNPGDDLAGDTLAADTLESDSLLRGAGDDEDVDTIPIVADELFDDFIFNFIKSPRLQMRRIIFPLVQYKTSHTDTIQRNEWEMESFFEEQDYYTLLLDNAQQMEMVRDTAVHHAIIEKIYLMSGYVTQYVFNRLSGKWMMTSINDTTYYGTPNEAFLRFYDRFSTDTLFQETALNNPLLFSGPDPDDDFRAMEGTLLPEQWRYFAPDLPRGMIYNIVYGTPARSTTEKLFVVRGISNGLEVELTFRCRDGRWKLARLTM